jgi:SAM-dependent methyltransferase
VSYTYRFARSLWQRSPQWLRRAVAGAAPLRALRDGVTSLAGHDDVYDAGYYDFIDHHAVQSADVMADSIVRTFQPHTVLDVGCGSGALLDALRRRGIEGSGLEYSHAGLARCQSRGLTVHRYDLTSGTIPALSPAYDVVVSFEVGEHLPATQADAFVALLTGSTRCIAFSAATPGQGGSDHINEQPHEYWLEKFAARSFRCDVAETERWRRSWADAEAAGRIAWWYARNVIVLRRD